MTKTAVVILNYNGENFLRQFLPKVVALSGSAEIVVVDNASTDESIYLLEKEFPAVRLIALEQNFGFCGGYNRGLQQVKAQYYVLLNSDVEVTPGWLNPLETLLDSNPEIAAVQPKILSYHRRDEFEYAGAAGGFIDAFGYPFCRGRFFEKIEKDHGQYDDERQIFWASGACLFIRSEVFHQFGGLDEDFFAHMEEIDLCWKIQRTQRSVWYSGKSTVYHVGAGTLGYDSPFKTFLNFRNGLSLLFKHLDSGELFLKIPIRMILDWLAAFSFLLKGRTGSFKSVFKAHYLFIRNLERDLKKRRSLRSEYPGYSRDAIYKGLLLIKYYASKSDRLSKAIPANA